MSFTMASCDLTKRLSFGMESMIWPKLLRVENKSANARKAIILGTVIVSHTKLGCNTDGQHKGVLYMNGS